MRLREATVHDAHAIAKVHVDSWRTTYTGVVPHSPLGNGFLTGKYTPDKTNIPKGTRMDIAPDDIELYWHDRGFRVDRGLREKSAELAVPIVRLAMAWVMTHPDITSVLIGARETSHIDNALEAYEMGMDQEVRDEMSSWSA